MANVNIQLGYKDSAWFTANATLVLLAGQVVYLQQTGTYKIGDGTTQLQNLAFKGVSAQTELVIATVVNNTGVNLLASNYQAVKVSTAQGQRLAVDFAQANNDNNSADTIGIVRQNITNNQEGEVVILGTISELNTTGSLQGETWADGDILYLSPTVAGQITKVKPNGLTGHMVVIGYVEYAHSQHGKIYVKIQNGYELEELHNTADVTYSTPIDADSLLIKDSTASLWKRLTWANLKTALSSLFVGKTGNETIAGNKTFTGAIQVANGTASNVAIQIGNTINLGFYSSSANKLDFVTNGAVRMSINADGTVVMGTASTNIIGNNYLDYATNTTGIRLTSTTLTFSTGTGSPGTGVNYMRIFQTGNLLLQNGGTFTDAGYRLDVNGTVRIQDMLTVGRLATEPTTNLQNGQIYYNTTTNKFRAYENGAWANLI